MTRHLNTTPFVGELALFINQEGAALYAEMLLTVHFLELDNVKQRADVFVLVRDKIKIKILFGFKVLLRT